MLRPVLAALVCLGVAGCAAPVFPSGGPSASASAGDLVRMGIAAVAALLVASLLLRRRRHSAGEVTPQARYLLTVLVVTVSGAGILLVLDSLLGASSPVLRGTVASAAAIAWGAMLVAHLRSVIVARRWTAVARAGSFFAVAQVPAWLLAVWVEVEGEWTWRVAWSLAVLAVACGHAIYLTVPRLRIGQRWLVPATLCAAAALVATHLLPLATTGRVPEVGARLGGALFAMVVTGTVLVVACRRLDPAPPEEWESSEDPSRPRP